MCIILSFTVKNTNQVVLSASWCSYLQLLGRVNQKETQNESSIFDKLPPLISWVCVKLYMNYKQPFLEKTLWLYKYYDIIGILFYKQESVMH